MPAPGVDSRLHWVLSPVVESEAWKVTAEVSLGPVEAVKATKLWTKNEVGSGKHARVIATGVATATERSESRETSCMVLIRYKRGRGPKKEERFAGPWILAQMRMVPKEERKGFIVRSKRKNFCLEYLWREGIVQVLIYKFFEWLRWRISLAPAIISSIFIPSISKMVTVTSYSDTHFRVSLPRPCRQSIILPGFHIIFLRLIFTFKCAIQLGTNTFLLA